MAYERQCICCGKTYQYCPHCGSFSNHPKWMFNYDQESCMELFNVVSAYNMGVVKKEDVIAVVKKYNVTDFSKYKDSIKKLLKELCAPEKKPEPVVPTAPIEVVTPAVNEQKKNKKNKFYFEKNKDIELKNGEISE